MMDDSTVQTTLEPREANETSALDVVTTDSMTIPTSRSATVQTGDGMELTAMVPDRRLPAEYRGRVYYSTTLHPDGSPCYKDCPCGTGQRHQIHAEKPLQFGTWESEGWTWAANEVALFGWRRTGPNAEEQKLKTLLDDIKEDLGHEEYFHSCTQDDLTASQEQRGKLRLALRRWRKEAGDAEHRYGIALQLAWAGWSAAILLAAYLIESVI